MTRYALEVGGSSKELGELQFNVLTFVSAKEYDNAVTYLEEFSKKKSAYPQYQRKTERLFEHAAGLVRAIETKIGFPNLGGLAQSKQDEIHQKTLENWEDLKLSLRRIRTVERDLLVEDAKSSIYVVRAILFSIVFLLVVFTVKEAYRNFGKSFISFYKESEEMFFDIFDGR